MVNLKELPHSPARDYLLERGGRPDAFVPDALDHLAFALILDAGEAVENALAALQKVRQDYVDWNEVRVSRIQELARSLEAVNARDLCAVRIIEEYNAFFEKRGALSFDFLESCKVAEGRKLLQQYLPRLRKGAISLLLFEFCPGASLPLSDEALKTARKYGLASKTGDRNQFAKTVSDQLPPPETARLAQFLELEAVGHPYGDSARGETAKIGKKKTVKK